MSKKTRNSRKGRPRRRARAVSEKTPKTYRLSVRKIAAAREILGAPTDTATIEEALDMVVFRKELARGMAAMRGVRIAKYDD